MSKKLEEIAKTPIIISQVKQFIEIVYLNKFSDSERTIQIN